MLTSNICKNMYWICTDRGALDCVSKSWYFNLFSLHNKSIPSFQLSKKRNRMADWLGSLMDIVSLVADSKAILAGGIALVSGSIAGVTPRVGLVRALSLGFKSYFKTTNPLSVRKSEVKQLSDLILRMKKGSYITVTGGKGNGKTCLINTTLNRHLGVVKISVSCLSYSILYESVK